MTEEPRTLQSWVDTSDNIVFFGGAGVSTESGIPDFRSVDGLYHQKYDQPPEVILSHDYFEEHTQAFYRFYRDKMLYPQAKPNPAHLKLAELERAVDAISQADVLIVGGTSLVVYPAAGLLRYYRGRRLALVNLSATDADRRADLVIHAPIGQVLGQLRV